MPTLIDLLLQYPVLEPLVTSLTFGDLLNLSRVSSRHRAALHGFEHANADVTLRNLFIGQHQTTLWEGLKMKSRHTCMEPTHRSTNHKVRNCRLCPRLICEACIIRDSYSKRVGRMLQTRFRNLCRNCCVQNRPHRRATIGPLVNSRSLVTCRCKAKDGVFCLGCKASQNENFSKESSNCFGERCEADVTENWGARVCIWCDRHISRTLADSRREYDVRHLNARLFATYERVPNSPVETWVWETLPAKQTAPLDLRDNRHHGYDCPCGEATIEHDIEHTCTARPTSD